MLPPPPRSKGYHVYVRLHVIEGDVTWGRMLGCGPNRFPFVHPVIASTFCETRHMCSYIMKDLTDKANNGSGHAGLCGLS